jgi:hypothetical protein
MSDAGDPTLRLEGWDRVGTGVSPVHAEQRSAAYFASAADHLSPDHALQGRVVMDNQHRSLQFRHVAAPELGE